MIKLQNPDIPSPLQAIEIDKAIYEIDVLLQTNLDWIESGYGRAYRNLDINNVKLFYPEVYIGDQGYFKVTPDNDKKGQYFFVAGEEKNLDFEVGQFNYLKWNVGIVFAVNLKLIDKDLSNNEIFTQNLIKDVREVLTRQGRGLNFAYKIKTVQREFNEIYKEFRVEEKEPYLKMPMQGFRFNLELSIQEDCENLAFNRVAAIIQNLSPEEKREVLKVIDFNDPENFGALTLDQKTTLQGLL